jgi:hypothetical protein
MFIIINRANLVVNVTSDIRYVKRHANDLAINADKDDADAIYVEDNDTFYPTVGSLWSKDVFIVVEVEEVPDEVIANYWYWRDGEFYTTLEKEIEYENSIVPSVLDLLISVL